VGTGDQLTPGYGRVAGLLLAAGQGSRLGRPKALVQIGGKTLAERGVAMLRRGGAEPVIVVTGAAAFSLPGVITVHNPDWPSGMGSSLRVGLAALPAGIEAVVIALADQPLVGSRTVGRLVDAYVAGATVAVACYQGQPRNPVLLARSHWAAAAASAQGDAGARAFLRANQGLVTTVECGDTGRPDDLDTAEDLIRISALMSEAGCVPDQD
jgi:nicotine blue oxidoreductase